jgi:hypothetical protein
MLCISAERRVPVHVALNYAVDASVREHSLRVSVINKDFLAPGSSPRPFKQRSWYPYLCGGTYSTALVTCITGP